MSIIKSSQPPPQPASTSGVSRHQAGDDKHLSKRDVQTILLAAGGGLSSLFIIAWLLLPLSAKILPFVLASAWPLLTLIVVAYQAVVYRRQWNAMQDALDQTDRVIDKMQDQWEIMTEQLRIERAKTDPRIRITDVRSINLDIDKMPIFRVALVNDGLLPTDVDFLLGVKIDDREFWNNKRTIAVAAGEKEYQFVEAHFVLEQRHIDTFNKAGAAPSLMVVGRFSYFPHVDPSTPKEFCFKYLPWPWQRERPEGIPEFIPCEHETVLNIGLRIQDSTHGHTAENVTLVQERAKPEPDQGNENGKREDDEGNPN